MKKSQQDIITVKFMESRNMLFGYIHSIVYDFHLAEDILQDTMLVAIKKSEQLKSIDYFPGWIRKIAYFESLNALKKQKKELVMTPEIINQLEDLWQEEDVEPEKKRLQALRTCMEMLKPKAREMLNLRYFKGISGDVLAKKLRTKVTSAYSRLTKIHRKLETCIKSKLER